MPGKICKDYRFTPDEYLGSVEYFYNFKGYCVQEDRYSADHNSRHIVYTYTDKGLLFSRTESDEKENIRLLNEYYYNEFDSLITESLKVDGILTRITVNTYDASGKRILQKTENKDGNVVYIEYEYDNAKLLKETHKDFMGNMLMYILHDTYSNQVKRQRTYDSRNILIRTDISIFDSEGKITERKSYRDDLHLFQWEHWTYDQDLLIKYARNNGDDFPLDYILYQY